jgi:DNA-binding transcriptional regulator YhcF (GntR family)
MKWWIDADDRAPLHEQIANCVLRALDEGEIEVGERLPPAAELSAVLDVNPNTVLHAYRRLRVQGVLEFRRGRGVRVSAAAADRARVIDAARHLLDVGRANGYSPRALANLVEELA